MKRLLLFLLAATTLRADGPPPIVLDAQAMENIGIEVATADERTFEETVFALGRIAFLPDHRAFVSSRVPGRALEVLAQHDHPIEKDAPVVVLESRQPGDPPPHITLTAPISGLVNTMDVAVGEPVDPDDALVEILDLNTVYAIADVPEHLAGQLEPGDRARIAVPAVGNRIYEARIEHLGAHADPEAGTVEAAFRVQNSNHALRPGMRAEFSIVVDERKDVMAVPRAAIQGDPANRVVYVRDFDLSNAFHQTPVTLGMRNDQFVEILSGLFPGDEVVTKGSYLLGFAGTGGGGISLKEALDAAHGHEHAEDGSELTDAERRARAEAAAAEAGHAHPSHTSGTLTLFLGITCAILLVLLILATLRRRPTA